VLAFFLFQFALLGGNTNKNNAGLSDLAPNEVFGEGGDVKGQPQGVSLS